MRGGSTADDHVDKARDEVVDVAAGMVMQSAMHEMYVYPQLKKKLKAHLDDTKFHVGTISNSMLSFFGVEHIEKK